MSSSSTNPDKVKLEQVEEKLEQVEEEMYKQFAAVKNISLEGKLVNIKSITKLMSCTKTTFSLFGYRN